MVKTALKRSRFRTKFKLDAEDRTYIEKRDLTQIRLHALDFIRRRLAPADPKNDGKQTPFKGHPVFKAQHATATCCRGCLAKWHKIKKGRSLSGPETEKVVGFIMEWIEDQLKKGGSS